MAMNATSITAREELLGHLLAIVAHPLLAWRRVSRTERALILLAYFSAGYLAGLLYLLTSSR